MRREKTSFGKIASRDMDAEEGIQICDLAGRCDRRFAILNHAIGRSLIVIGDESPIFSPPSKQELRYKVMAHDLTLAFVNGPRWTVSHLH